MGKALAEVFAEGKIKREDVFITSKLFNDSHASAAPYTDASPEHGFLRRRTELRLPRRGAEGLRGDAERPAGVRVVSAVQRLLGRRRGV